MEFNTVEKNVIDKRCFSFEVINADTVVFKYRPNVIVDVDDINDVLECMQISSADKKIKGLVISGPNSSVTSAARRYSNQALFNFKAQAYVVNQMHHRLLLKFYMKLKTENHPVKVFSNKDEALNWLHGQ